MHFYCIKQHDITDCGAACLATISRQYGLKTSVTKIREIAGTDKQGTTVRSLISQYDSLEKESLLAKDKVSTSQKSPELEQKKYSLGFSTKLLILDKETELRKNEYSLEILRAQKLKPEFMLEKGII